MNMKKVYLLYIILSITEYKDKYYTILEKPHQYKKLDEERMIGLYAFTTKKSYMKEFLKVRNKKRFYLKTVEMEEDEFHEWRIDNLTFELSKYPIPTDKTKENNVIVLCTKYEYIMVTENTKELLIEQFQPYLTVDYMVFTEEYQKALDIIGYTTMYDIIVGGDPNIFSEEEMEERVDYANYNLSFNQTIYGKLYPINFVNQFNLFISLFRFSFM